MNMKASLIAFLTVILAIPTIPLWAQSDSEPQNSGFLSDYSNLEPVPGNPAARMYIAPDGPEALKSFKSALVEQAEIFIAPDSPYKGTKPDEIKLLADTFSGLVEGELKQKYTIVQQNGKGVLQFRFAISNIVLTHKMSKNPLAYTPIGAAVHLTRKALSDDLMQKYNLSAATLELEILNGGTGEVLAAGTERHQGSAVLPAGQEGEKTSWQEVENSMHITAQRLACRIDNATLPEDQRKNCLKIGAGG
jgi:hypothetical protein